MERDAPSTGQVTTHRDDAVPERATRRTWIGLGVIALPCILYAMDLTVLFLAVPALQRDLDPSATELLWISDVYGFVLAGLLVTMGRLGDRIGRRRLLLWGATAFAAASVLAAFAPTPGALIAARALLGVAGATLAPSTLALVSVMFRDPQQRRVAIGVWVTSFSVGAALGPLVGGVLLELFWWGSVFLLAVPVTAILLLVGPRLLPEHREPRAGAFDVPGAALSIVAVLGLVFALKRVAHDGPDPAAAAALVAGALLGTAFLRRQARAQDPLVDLRLFTPSFGTALTANALGIFVIAGIDLLVALHLQLSLGLSPLEAGLWTVPSAGGFVVGATLAPRLAVRRAPEAVVVAGLVLVAAGLGVLLLVTAGGGLAYAVGGTTVVAVGAAFVVTLATDLVVGAAPRHREGSASALSETATELGGALGIAVLGSVAATTFRRAMDGLDGVPAAARETLAGAVDADLPPGALAIALEASARGLHLAAGAAAVLSLLVAVLVLRAPRPPAAAPAPGTAGEPLTHSG